MEQSLLKDLPVEKGIAVAHLLRLTNLDIREGKKGFYLMFTLGDGQSELPFCKKWDSSRAEYDSLKGQQFVFVKGKTDVWNEKLSIVADSIAIPKESELTDEMMSALVPHTPYIIKELADKFYSFLKKLQNPYLQELCRKFIKDKEVKQRLFVSPAAVKFHHSYRGGLLTHIVRLMELADAIVDSYNYNCYPNNRIKINKDLIMVGCFLHDLYKISEYTPEGEYDHRGGLVPHLARGPIEASRRMDQIEGFPDELRWQLNHLLLSHHGQIEWGSPVTPQTVEAVCFHHIDNMAAKIDPMLEALDELPEEASWTDRIPAIGRKNAYLGGMMFDALGYDESFNWKGWRDEDSE